MTDFTQLTTVDLIEYVRASNDTTPRELELLERLVAALDEIDTLSFGLHQVQRELTEASSGADT